MVWVAVASTRAVVAVTVLGYTLMRKDLGRHHAPRFAARGEMLAEFVIEGSWSGIADAVADRYDGIATRVVNYFGAIAWADEPVSMRPWRDITRALAT